MTPIFYLTHVIEKSNVLDQASAYCLSPLHDLLRVFGTKNVRVFTFDNSIGYFKEIQSSIKLTILKIIKIVFLIIPGSILGACLKFFALNKETKASYHKLLKSIPFLALHERECKDSEYIKRIPNIVITRFVIKYLTISDLARLASVDTKSWKLIHYPTQELGLYQTGNREGIIKVSHNTFHDYIHELIEKWHLDQPELRKIFRTVDKILNLPVIHIKAELDIKKIENLSPNKKFSEYPDLFRLCGSNAIFILFKTTIFLPKEYTRGENSVWHDYSILFWNSKLKKWAILEPRTYERALQYRKQRGCPEAPMLLEPPAKQRSLFLGWLENPKITARLQKLFIENRMIALHDRPALKDMKDLQKEANCDPFFPHYILGSIRRLDRMPEITPLHISKLKDAPTQEMGDVYHDLPVAFRHVRAEHFKFIRERLGIVGKTPLDPAGATEVLVPVL